LLNANKGYSLFRNRDAGDASSYRTIHSPQEGRTLRRQAHGIAVRRPTVNWLHAQVAMIGVAVLGACATAPRLAPPRVAVDAVRLERITGTEARFDVILRLDNPNAREIAVDAIDARVTIDDVPVGTATLKVPLRLPANGDATATLQARAGLAEVLRLAADFAQRVQDQKGTGQPTQVRYAVSGSATLEGGTTIPFSRTGEFRIGASATFAR
jgi:LEA14-like dessication related protein